MEDSVLVYSLNRLLHIRSLADHRDESAHMDLGLTKAQALVFSGIQIVFRHKRINGGGRGIRTPERVTPLTVFKTAGFNHSPIPPFIIVADSLQAKLPVGARCTRLTRGSRSAPTSARDER